MIKSLFYLTVSVVGSSIHKLIYGYVKVDTVALMQSHT